MDIHFIELRYIFCNKKIQKEEIDFKIYIMKSSKKSTPNRKHGWTALALIFMCLSACDNDDQWMMGDIPENGQMASYSNKLSAPVGGNELILHYSGSPVIGKEVKFGRDQVGKGILTLCGILPGKPEYTINRLTLVPAENGYTFEGSVAENTGLPFKYQGKVEKKKLTVRISEATVPANALTGQWYILPNNGDTCDSTRQIGQELSWHTICNTIYTQVGEFTAADGEALFDPTAIPSIVPLAFNLAVNPVLSCLVGTSLRDITFQEDGNITATYAGLPDTLDFSQMMSGKGIIRNAADWQASPVNLATYYPAGDTTLYIMPNVDMIIRQIEANKALRTKAGIPQEAIGGILGIYLQLSQWGTTGIKLHIRPNNPGKYTWTGDGKYVKYEGNYMVYIDKSEIEALFAILDIVKMLIPAETINLPLDELLLANGIDVAQTLREMLGDELAAMIVPIIHKFTVNNLLTQIKADLNEDPLQLGIWLSETQIPAGQN